MYLTSSWYGYMLVLYYMTSFQWKQSKSWSALYLIANKERECLEEEVWSVAGAWWASAWAGHSRGGNSSSFLAWSCFSTIPLYYSATALFSMMATSRIILQWQSQCHLRYVQCSGQRWGGAGQWWRGGAQPSHSIYPAAPGLHMENNQNLTIKPIMIE